MTPVLYLFYPFENIRHSTFILLIVNIGFVAADAFYKKKKKYCNMKINFSMKDYKFTNTSK